MGMLPKGMPSSTRLSRSRRPIWPREVARGAPRPICWMSARRPRASPSRFRVSLATFCPLSRRWIVFRETRILAAKSSCVSPSLRLCTRTKSPGLVIGPSGIWCATADRRCTATGHFDYLSQSDTFAKGTHRGAGHRYLEEVATPRQQEPSKQASAVSVAQVQALRRLAALLAKQAAAEYLISEAPEQHPLIKAVEIGDLRRQPDEHADARDRRATWD